MKSKGRFFKRLLNMQKNQLLLIVTITVILLACVALWFSLKSLANKPTMLPQVVPSTYNAPVPRSPNLPPPPPPLNPPTNPSFSEISVDGTSSTPTVSPPPFVSSSLPNQNSGPPEAPPPPLILNPNIAPPPLLP